MRAIFGVVSLLVVLAVIGFVASRQLKAVSTAPAAAPLPGPAEPPAANVREQSLQLQQRVKRDAAAALQQGADRNEQADK
jgi:hypothetical protein